MVFVSFMYPPAVTLPKLSVLFLYLRVFGEKRAFRIATYMIMAVLVTSCVTAWIVLFALCRPFRYTWDKTVAGGSCGDSMKVYAWLGFPSFRRHNVTWVVMESGMYLIAACLPALPALFGPLVKRMNNAILSRLRYYAAQARSEKGSNPYRTGTGNSPRREARLERRSISDGNNQKDWVSCYYSDSMEKITGNNSGVDLESGSSSQRVIQVHKEYIISTAPAEAVERLGLEEEVLRVNGGGRKRCLYY
ncbi:hypothetical protein HYFRA_00009139 [Hymenoscyphus fraxineus]|uniref:Rhodopsin domain-containing protein n=1 Tax=Hymenoscyphus fraxineus TaxID=746836 RepID=A0A9N9KV40_9HELO|nr:hypothetical protein HYFRA_00009139 [Hymenoscyphus fraxineus]